MPFLCMWVELNTCMNVKSQKFWSIWPTCRELKTPVNLVDTINQINQWYLCWWGGITKLMHCGILIVIITEAALYLIFPSFLLRALVSNRSNSACSLAFSSSPAFSRFSFLVIISWSSAAELSNSRWHLTSKSLRKLTSELGSSSNGTLKVYTSKNKHLWNMIWWALLSQDM